MLSPRLKPSVTGSIGIQMADGEGNMIRDWDRVFTTKVRLVGTERVADGGLQGVWAASLEISPRPVLGNWNISVDVNGQIFSKAFQVAEYILPKFQVGGDRLAVTQ